MRGSEARFLKPRTVDIEQVASSTRQVTLEPLERGFGHTLACCTAPIYSAAFSCRCRVARGDRVELMVYYMSAAPKSVQERYPAGNRKAST